MVNKLLLNPLAPTLGGKEERLGDTPNPPGKEASLHPLIAERLVGSLNLLNRLNHPKGLSERARLMGPNVAHAVQIAPDFGGERPD